MHRVISARPDLSVVVVTHDGRELALATLRSATQAVGDLAVEWHVVDSGSTDGTPEAVERHWPRMASTRLANAGFATATNVALRTARGRYVLLLNPDVEIVSGTFGALIRALDARPEVGLASVVQRAPEGALIPSICRDPSPARQLGEALGASRLRLLRGLQEPHKHLSSVSRVAFRAALAVRHALRTAVLAPVAAVRPARRARLQAEAAALGIVLGLRGPSWSPSMPSGTERTAIGQPAMAREDRGRV